MGTSVWQSDTIALRNPLWSQQYVDKVWLLLILTCCMYLSDIAAITLMSCMRGLWADAVLFRMYSPSILVLSNTVASTYMLEQRPLPIVQLVISYILKLYP